MRPIKTGCWFARIPDDHIKISISRGSPRGIAGYRNYQALAPGPWFNSIPPREYLTRYREQLTALNPAATISRIEVLAGDKIPVLCCFESTAKIQTGETWCHRHLVKRWLEHSLLGIEVLEIGASAGFNPFLFFEKMGIDLAEAGYPSPTGQPSSPVTDNIPPQRRLPF